ncbi:MAG TPA: hypothetical protein VEP30_09585 [Chthoniobacterales bacterium]|nr:hypothetical protein [Chthoniobacterales bacterium]
MKFVWLAFLFLPLVSPAADPLLNMAEGTTWNYELVQEKPSNSFDLTEPNEEEHFNVTYRLGGNEKIDNKDWARLEVYRGENLESVDLILPSEEGIICQARMDAQRNLTKINPPQQLVKRPFRTGTSWDFDGTIGDTKVSQHYEIVGEEDVDVPAGKFHAWRIHCEQTSPGPATIDRWFVPTTGFVKVETAVKGASGGVLQKTSLKLKELPKVASAPRKNTAPQPEILSAGVSSEPKGEFKAQFKIDTPAIYARWHGQGLPEHTKIRASFIAENVADVSADYEIDETSAVAPNPNSSGTFTLSQPEGGWAPGNYRVEFFIDHQPAETVKFKITK